MSHPTIERTECGGGGIRTHGGGSAVHQGGLAILDLPQYGPECDYLFIRINAVVVILLFLPVTRPFFSR